MKYIFDYSYKLFLYFLNRTYFGTLSDLNFINNKIKKVKKKN